MVTDAKKELAKQIKAAIRSQRRTPKIYDVVKQHSFSNIPLIPIEEPDEPENLEINTSFTVTVSLVLGKLLSYVDFTVEVQVDLHRVFHIAVNQSVVYLQGNINAVILCWL